MKNFKSQTHALQNAESKRNGANRRSNFLMSHCAGTNRACRRDNISFNERWPFNGFLSWSIPSGVLWAPITHPYAHINTAWWIFGRKFKPANSDGGSRTFSKLRSDDDNRMENAFYNGLETNSFGASVVIVAVGSNCGVKWCCFSMLMQKEAEDINIHHLEHSINSTKDELPSTHSLSAPPSLSLRFRSSFLFASKQFVVHEQKALHYAAKRKFSLVCLNVWD